MLYILIGLISGIVSGTGMGGGTILILLLSLFMGIDQHVAQATNLVFFIPTSISAIITNYKQKLVEWKLGITIAIFGVIGAIIGAKISLKIDANNLKKYFGIFLGLIAIYEIYSMVKEYIIKNKRHNNYNQLNK